MILSVSRRTDIPAFYSKWFFDKIEKGTVFVRNPVNLHQISKINIMPDLVDGIVFWTKNPMPMMNHLDLLKYYTYYFQFTLTSYGKDVEPHLPDKKNVLIPVFKRLSDLIGPERVIWRYDPVFINYRYTLAYHVRAFEEIASQLQGYTKKVVFSFIDVDYKEVRSNTALLNMTPLDFENQNLLAEAFSETAYRHNMQIETCAENIDLEKYGIEHARCVDDRLFSKLLNSPLAIHKDKYQRKNCGCVESVDIGAYNTCRNGCLYCYANYNHTTIPINAHLHDYRSNLLIGSVSEADTIKERLVRSYKNNQLSFL